jgi:hypothetical protein
MPNGMNYDDLNFTWVLFSKSAGARPILKTVIMGVL